MVATIDEVGSWTETKLKIIEAYAKEYSKILANNHLYYIYVDGFAGAGKHFRKGSNTIISGSPKRVLDIIPPFNEYHFVEIEDIKVTELMSIVQNRPEAKVYKGNCNEILPKVIFPTITFSNKKRGFCLIDPYGLDLEWQVIKKAGEMGTVDLLINFPIMDINRNILRNTVDNISQNNVKRMCNYWGDDSWKAVAYDAYQNLFGLPMRIPYAGNKLRDRFNERLHSLAGFKYVAKPLRMRNVKHSTVYYLFFASQKEVAVKIMQYIFDHNLS